MTIESLLITDVRNLVSVVFEPSPDINIFYGSNGSGKTSVLEAIYLLGMARSFRSSKIKPVIRNTCQSCTVFGNISTENGSVSVGVTRTFDGEYHIKVAGDKVNNVSLLAAILPTQVINPDTFRLLEGAPKNRRQFIDWGVFHEERRFLPLWQRLQKCLRQRNTLLRHGKIDYSQLHVWDSELVTVAENIDQLRANYVERLLPIFDQIMVPFSNIPRLEVNYYRGWDKDLCLSEVLKRNIDRDISSGYTHAGPQRADLKVRLDRMIASDILSRGQQKIVVCVLKLAQGLLFHKTSNRACTYLVDDLPSELDTKHWQLLCDTLETMKSQVFLTGVKSKEGLVHQWSEQTQVKMFHVEQGKLSNY
ncbi:MAG: DNA replication/repair protein RecF [Endozoicomonadaceae bacterium]|nr:DNA replication/repair protein RecF [Endozoicomonadaceae bacterium]